MRFLVISAGLPGLWKRLDEYDPRMGDLLIGCYGEGLSTAKLAGKVPGVKSGGNAGYLITRGLTKLFEWMPEASDDFPLDKHLQFPLKSLVTGRGVRMKVAGTQRAKTTGNSEWGKAAAGRRWWSNDGGSNQEGSTNE